MLPRPCEPLKRRQSMVRLLPSGPDPVPMMKSKGSILRSIRCSTSDPEGQSLTVGIRLDARMITPPPIVAPTIDDFGVKGDAEHPGLV